MCVLDIDVYLFLCLTAQPVHDELEYIKMRYKSPARSSFRDNKTYETLTTRSTYSTVDRGVDGPHCSDDSFDRSSQKTGKGSTCEKDKKKHAWSKPSPTMPGQTRIEGYEPGDPNHRYNIIGETQGVTVI